MEFKKKVESKVFRFLGSWGLPITLENIEALLEKVMDMTDHYLFHRNGRKCVPIFLKRPIAMVFRLVIFSQPIPS